jgi:hypothetical protein
MYGAPKGYCTSNWIRNIWFLTTSLTVEPSLQILVLVECLTLSSRYRKYVLSEENIFIYNTVITGKILSHLDMKITSCLYLVDCSTFLEYSVQLFCISTSCGPSSNKSWRSNPYCVIQKHQTRLKRVVPTEIKWAMWKIRYERIHARSRSQTHTRTHISLQMFHFLQNK